MFEVIKSLTASGKLRDQSHDLQLEGLVAEARQEREALGAALQEFSARHAEIKELTATLERVERQSTDSAARLDALTARLDGLHGRAASLAGIEQRIHTLVDAAAQAERTVERLTAPEGDLQAHRRQMQQLTSQVLETQASLTALKRERAALEESRADLRQSRADVTQSVEAASTLKTDLEQVRALAGRLTGDYARLEEASRQAREDSAAAVAAVKEAEKKLGPLVQVQELGRTTEEKLTLLNSLAEHVNQKVKTLDGQKHALDRAVVEANRLNEMVWSMDAQIARLHEGMKEAARSEDTLARIERLAEETDQQFDLAQKVRHEFGRDVARFERDGRSLVDTMRGAIETLALERSQFDTFNQRLRALHSAIEHAEARADALESHQRLVGDLSQQATGLKGELQALSEQADELAHKQAGLDALHERLSLVDDLAKQTSLRYDSLRQSRADLETLRRDIHELHKAQLEAGQLRDRLAADRAALEAFGERMTAMRGRTPQLEQDIDTLLGKLSGVHAATTQAIRLGEMAEHLDAQLGRVADRVQVVEALEARMNALHAVSSDVDARMSAQLAKRGDVDGLRTTLDGLTALMLDAQQKAETVAAVQQRLLPLEERVRSLHQDLESAAASVEDIRRQEAATADRRASLERLLEENRALAAETAERVLQTQALNDSLAGTAAARDELLAGLSDVEKRQREALALSEALAEHVRNVEGMHATLEERRDHLGISARKLGAVEMKLQQLEQRAGDLDDKMQTLADREAVVRSVKEEVDQVHQVSLKSRADLEFVSGHRDEIATVRQRVDALLATAADAEDKIAAIEARRGTIDAVHAKANLIANLLEDVRVNLETLGEQKAVMDHVATKLARLDFMMQEAQNTLRTLQHERELAERIEQNIAQLRTRTALS